MTNEEIQQICIWGVALSIPAGLIAFAFLKKQSGALKSLLETVALKYNGQAVVSQWQFLPLLKIPHEQGEMVFTFRMEKRNKCYRTVPPMTSIKATLVPGPRLDLTIARGTLLMKMAGNLGIDNPETSTGNPAFDTAFICKAQDPAMTLALLSPEIQQRLIDIADWMPSVRMKGQFFCMEIEHIPDTEMEFECLIEIVNRILEKA